MSRRPTGTLARSAVLPVEAAQTASDEKLERKKRRAAQFVYATFGITVEPFVAFEGFAGQFPPHERVAVELPGLPLLNFGADKDGPFLAFVRQCLVCDSLIGTSFSDAEGLGAILAAPLRRCSTCAKYGPTPLLNVVDEAE